MNEHEAEELVVGSGPKEKRNESVPLSPPHPSFGGILYFALDGKAPNVQRLRIPDEAADSLQIGGLGSCIGYADGPACM